MIDPMSSPGRGLFKTAEEPPEAKCSQIYPFLLHNCAIVPPVVPASFGSQALTTTDHNNHNTPHIVIAATRSQTWWGRKQLLGSWVGRGEGPSLVHLPPESTMGWLALKSEAHPDFR